MREASLHTAYQEMLVHSPQSSQLAELLWTTHSLKSGIGVQEPISTWGKRKNKHKKTTTTKKDLKAQNDLLNLPPKSSHVR